MFSKSDKSRMPVAMVAVLAISTVLSGCLDGSDFAAIEAPSWESGYSWDWNMEASSVYSSANASGSSSHSESMRMTVEGTAELEDGASAYILSHEQGMSQLYDSSRLELVSQEGLEPLARSWDDIDCNEDIRWRDGSRYSPSMFPPIRYPVVAGTSWTTQWDGMEWDVEVLAKEEVEVAAGSFDAVEIRFESASQGVEDGGTGMEMGMFDGMEDFEFDMSVWYAEGARQIVKLAGENRWTRLVEGEPVEHTNTIDIELTSYSLEAKKGVELESVVIGQRQRVQMPPLRIVSDEDMPLNSAEGNTTVTFSLEEVSGVRVPPRFNPDGPPGSMPDEPDSAPEYEYPEDWDEDELYWALTKQTGHFSEERLAEGRGAEFTVDLPEYGDFRVRVSDHPIPERNDSVRVIELESVMVSSDSSRSCSGATSRSTFTTSTWVQVYIEDGYTIDQSAGLPEETLLGSFVAPDTSGILVANYEIQPDWVYTDDAELVLIAPDGERTSVAPDEDVSIDQAGEWQLVWDAKGFEGLIVTGHSAEVHFMVHPSVYL